ncbi:unnamed protein product [Gongylonema pulchrum]|uniref:Tumor protein p53-inducible protein 11 n=1 Tax=Gongylonema pulchrum TaxID=637853 RepID=A0A3P6PQB8_9BILA|nr:unnamed protein product [Gongylonema pulchrum]
MLGINESLYVRLPAGLVLWTTALTVYMHISGIACLIAPSLASDIEFAYRSPPTDLFPIRMYGVALVAYGLLFHSSLMLKDPRTQLSSILLSVVVLFGLQLIVGLYSGHLNRLLLFFRTVMLIGSFIYQSLVDAQVSIIYKLCQSSIFSACTYKCIRSDCPTSSANEARSPRPYHLLTCEPY